MHYEIQGRLYIGGSNNNDSYPPPEGRCKNCCCMLNFSLNVFIAKHLRIPSINLLTIKFDKGPRNYDQL